MKDPGGWKDQEMIFKSSIAYWFFHYLSMIYLMFFSIFSLLTATTYFLKIGALLQSMITVLGIVVVTIITLTLYKHELKYVFSKPRIIMTSEWILLPVNIYRGREHNEIPIENLISLRYSMKDYYVDRYSLYNFQPEREYNLFKSNMKDVTDFNLKELDTIGFDYLTEDGNRGYAFMKKNFFPSDDVLLDFLGEIEKRRN